MTFLTAPPTSTPTMSVCIYARKLGPDSREASALANAGSREATVKAVGKPAPTSLAKVGPDSTAPGLAPRISLAT